MTDRQQPTAIFSDFGGDIDMGELVEMFVDEMPERIALLGETLASGDMESLKRTAHQMKGAVGSYGFDQLTPYAAAVESSVRDGQPEEQIRQAVGELIDLCQRCRAGNQD